MIEQIATIPAGAKGVDFAYWRPGDEIAPWSYVVRYACKLPNGKALTANEAKFYLSLGVAVLLVWEQAANDWERGAAKGTEHGRLAAEFAANIGYPHGLTILAAFDTNATPGDARAAAYGNAFADEVIAAGYDFGPYSDLDVIRLLAARSGVNWLAGATSWSDPTKPYQPETMPGYELVHVRQVISGSTPSYDRNITLRPFRAWLPHDVPDDIEIETPTGPGVVAARQEDDMQAFTHSEPLDGHPPLWTFWVLMPDGTKRKLNGVELDVILRQRNSAPALDSGQLAQIPDWTPPATTVSAAPLAYTIQFSGAGTAQA